MKFLKLFAVAAIAFLSTQSHAQIKTVDVRTVKGAIVNYGHEAILTTTDSVVTAIDSIVVAANEAGIIRVTVVGYNADAPAGITGIKYVRYKKVAGTLTLGTVTDIAATVTDSELSGSTTWTIVASGNNIIVRVKGKIPLTSGIKWKCRTEYLSRP